MNSHSIRFTASAVALARNIHAAECEALNEFDPHWRDLTRDQQDHYIEEAKDVLVLGIARRRVVGRITPSAPFGISVHD